MHGKCCKTSLDLYLYSYLYFCTIFSSNWLLKHCFLDAKRHLFSYVKSNVQFIRYKMLAGKPLTYCFQSSKLVFRCGLISIKYCERSTYTKLDRQFKALLKSLLYDPPARFTNPCHFVLRAFYFYSKFTVYLHTSTCKVYCTSKIK